VRVTTGVESMPAHRGTPPPLERVAPAARNAVFVALGVTLLCVGIAFVYPGLYVTHCAPDYQVSTSRGVQSYCSDRVVVAAPSLSTGCTHDGFRDGATTTVLLGGAFFSFHSGFPCGGPVAYFLNYTINEGSGTHHGLFSIIPLTVLTPDERAGFTLLNGTGEGPQPILVFAQ
jgi:Na+-driven multidrug efflux pump